ncbi:MAG: 1-acyl-sn-glycerol-3-phosphate acyltransferase [Microbacteriaceae bacterium]|nr:1-acyl-sn-glycerol-3-phosphate acyltransferase [Microbacteriaceae bacterium]
MAKKSSHSIQMPELKPGKEITWQIRLLAFILRPWVRLLYKVEVTGMENLPRTGGYVLAANHVTTVDALAVAYMMYFRLHRAPHFLAKEGLFKTPIVGPVLLAVGQIPVFRGQRTNTDPMEAAYKVLRAGHVIGIFPEGTLTRDPDLWPMRGRTGAIRLAIETGVPIVPVGQWGTEEVMETYSSKLRPKPWHKVRMIIGEPIEVAKFVGKKSSTEDLVGVTDQVMAEITKLVEKLRGEKAPAKRFVPSEHGLPDHGNFKKFLIIKQENERRASLGLDPLPADAKVKFGKIRYKGKG